MRLVISVLLFVASFTTHSMEYIHGYHDFPPYVEKIEGKKGADAAGGTAVQVAKAIYQEAGLKVKFVFLPYVRMVDQLVNGQIHFGNYGGGLGNDEIERNLYLGAELRPVPITLFLFYKSDIEPPKSINDFINRRVVSMRAYPFGPFEGIKQLDGVKINVQTNMESSVKMLLRERADFLFHFKEPYDKGLAIENSGWQKLEQKVNSGDYKKQLILQMQGFPVAVSRNFEGAKSVQDTIINTIQILIDKGLLDPETNLLR